ncbi:hypothetical protein [Saccharothrix sp. Mg75]|uniref:hypothetical protein n=1 Tax=Saccharothrix sp. Mg75 TaxID=3445357 RepID=UPI003EEF191C
MDEERAAGHEESNIDVQLHPEATHEVLDAMRPIIAQVREQARDDWPPIGCTAPEAWISYYRLVGRLLPDAVLPPVRPQWLPGTAVPDPGPAEDVTTN